MTRIVIIGGGPAGYEAALVAAQLGAQVTVIERDGIGGASVLTDCVPSKTLIAAAGTMTSVRDSAVLGLQGAELATVSLDLASVNHRVKGLAMAQSTDIHNRLAAEGVRIVAGQGRLSDEIRGLAAHRVEVLDEGRVTEELESDVVLIATGADPRVLAGAEPDGERILDWRDVYDLDEMPEHLVVVGSGVTGAEFASGYLEAGVPVTLVSSRDQVLPGEDADAAEVLEEVFQSRGGRIAERGRAAAVKRTEKGVLVELTDGRTVEGSHALMTVGTVPNTAGLNLEQTGVEVTQAGHIVVDRVSRTSVPGIYAAGDVTGVFQLASVAAMQGRIAMWHALGEAVQPLKLGWVAANIFTDPEVATVGVSQAQIDSGEVPARIVKLPLATNPRAKMQGFLDGFVKLFCRPATGIVLGGVIVAPRASELILGLSMAVQQHLTVDQVAHTFVAYPSVSGSITEAARRLMQESAY
jgi:NAD(P)H dehydrogenase (quinone)